MTWSPASPVYIASTLRGAPNCLPMLPWSQARTAPGEELVWFLAPTAALCTQQHSVIEKQIRGVQIKRLIGADNCHTWTEPRIWNDLLRNVRVVVSTHQVLYDAISHAFVRLSRLSLLIFDEGKLRAPISSWIFTVRTLIRSSTSLCRRSPR